MCGRQGGSGGTPKLRQNHQSIKTSSTRRVPQNTLQHKNIKTRHITITNIVSDDISHSLLFLDGQASPAPTHISPSVRHTFEFLNQSEASI